MFLVGCKNESECAKNFYISGKVTDQSLNPLSDVQVIGVMRWIIQRSGIVSKLLKYPNNIDTLECA